MSLHIPVQDQRLFRPEKKYSEIKWSIFSDVVAEFKGRIHAWYIEPARALCQVPDAAFAQMALICLLIDTLSQYRYGAIQSPSETQPKPLKSSRSKFKDFIGERLPSLGFPLPLPIRIVKENGNPGELKTYAEVLYVGFRCGILHEAHIPLYGAISGQTTVTTWHPSGITTYADGTDCPTVVVFPKPLLDLLVGAFVNYVEELLNPDPKHVALRLRFKEKFEDSFGVTISVVV